MGAGAACLPGLRTATGRHSVLVWNNEMAAVAAAHSVDPDRWWTVYAAVLDRMRMCRSDGVVTPFEGHRYGLPGVRTMARTSRVSMPAESSRSSPQLMILSARVRISMVSPTPGGWA